MSDFYDFYLRQCLSLNTKDQFKMEFGFDRRVTKSPLCDKTHVRNFEWILVLRNFIYPLKITTIEKPNISNKISITYKHSYRNEFVW